MPGRGRVIATGGGFGGFAPNPTFDRNLSPEAFGDWQPQASEIHPPVLTSLPPSNPPRSTRTPLPSPGPTVVNAPPRRTDPSGAGLTPSTLGGNTLRSLSNDRYVRQPGENADTIASSGGRSPTFVTNQDDDWIGADPQPTIASGGGRPPPFISDPNEDWLGDPSQRTESTAGLPTEPGMGDEPVLFTDQSAPQPTATPTNEWTTSPGDRRFLPSPTTDPRYMAGFGGNMTIGQFLNTPLAFLRLGEGRGGAPSGGNVDLTQGGRDAYLSGGGRPPPITTDPNADWTGSAEGYESPEVAAMTPQEKEAAFAEAERRGEAETARTTGGGAPSNPASRFGNLSSPTGPAVYFDGRNWRPISSAPSDVRWSPNNPHNSNFTASETTKAYVAGGGDPGRPNDMSSAAMEGRFLLDEEGAPTMQGRMYGDRRGEFRMGQKSDAPPRYTDTASQLAYNNWLRQQPEYKAWLKSRGG